LAIKVVFDKPLAKLKLSTKFEVTPSPSLTWPVAVSTVLALLRSTSQQALPRFHF